MYTEFNSWHLSNREYISDHRCKMNCSKNFMAVKQILLPMKEYLRDHKYEGTVMAYKCKIFVTVL